MYAKIKQETDTKFSDLKAEFDLDNRIKAAINVAMAQQNQIMDMKNEALAKKQSDIMSSLENKVKKQMTAQLDEIKK